MIRRSAAYYLSLLKRHPSSIILIAGVILAVFWMEHYQQHPPKPRAISLTIPIAPQARQSLPPHPNTWTCEEMYGDEPLGALALLPPQYSWSPTTDLIMDPSDRIVCNGRKPRIKLRKIAWMKPSL